MGATYNSAEDLQSYFEKSAAIVRRVVDRAEIAYVRPGIKNVAESFEKRPLLSSFVAVFVFLSFLPIISFVGFSLFVIGTFTFLGLAGAFAASTVVVLVSGFVLACTLAFLLLIAFFLSSALLVGFLTTRLLLLVRTDGPRTGVTEWTKETKTRLYRGDIDSPSHGPSNETEEYVNSGGKSDDEVQSEGSVGSTVIVDGVDANAAPEKGQSVVSLKSEPE
ncbi:hypothetical protein EW026_g759 [Hermanssonia centrifuga]|uniref:Promethin n=1 Tax=Hermanssonia centrifuga TaxID=98765 RepID=A0A4S4KTM0_9APHY|nr:hypothetical protein EW026_g759 [Hermanssonia centrifuga]